MEVLWLTLPRAQDVDRGNVEEACNSVSLTHRVRFASNKLPAGKVAPTASALLRHVVTPGVLQ